MRSLAGRDAREVVHGARSDGRRPAGQDSRGPRPRRRAGSSAARVHRVPRAAVRILHAGHDAHSAMAARPQSRPDRGGRSRGHIGPGLPVHGVREHRPCGAVGCAGGRCRMTVEPEAYGRLGRKEDARFIRGLGTFVDDISLPGMLHGAILRSPVAHARIRSLDATAARAHPQVEAVLTGADLAERALAWMPTLAADVQAVLATDKVRFQGQEIAFVVARDRYSARDALELISVEYEPLQPVVDARSALQPEAPVVRDD